MGTNCAKPNRSDKGSSAEISDLSLKDHYHRPTNPEYNFNIKLHNLCLSCQLDEIYEIVFELNSKVKTLFPEEDLICNGKLKMWNTVRELSFNPSFSELRQAELTVKVYSKKKRNIQKLSLKFDELCRGPIHHDHLLPEMKSRVIFDIEISQFVDVSLICKSFHIFDKENQITDKSLKISLDLVVAQQNSQKEDSLKEVKHSITQIVHFDKKLLNRDLSQSSLRMVFWDSSLQMLWQIYIPYQKLMNLCSSYRTEKKKDINYVKRTVQLKELLKIQNQINCKAPSPEDKYLSQSQKKTIQLTLSWYVTETYVEQLQGVICSEKGICTVSPHLLTGQGGYSVFATSNNSQLDYKQLQLILKQYKAIKLKKNLTSHKKILAKTYESLTKQYQLQIDEDYQTIDYQFVLLDLMEEISIFLQDRQESINEGIWKIFGVIIRRPQLSIRYLHAIDNINDKKKIGIKFYRFLCSVLCMVVRSTGIGLTFAELKYSQKFIAYCYFRYPFIQRKFANQIIQKNNIYLSQEKLDELGVCVGMKSPSKTMVFDWESNLYNFVKKQPQQIEAQEKLRQIIQSLPDWSNMLFSYEDQQLYFGGLAQLMNEAEVTLLYQGKIMWEYFPGYSDLLGCLETEMKSNQPIGFTKYFRDFAVKLMRNQKLLNTFMKYLFSKTFLFQAYSVMRCIDIIRSCFDGIATKNNRKLPTNFNYNLFYQGIISILEINHSFLVIKTLNILYLYYDMLSFECQNKIDSFVLDKNFYNLFFHWHHLVRKMFMCFLQKHITPKYTKYEKLMKIQNDMEQSRSEILRQNTYFFRQVMAKIQEQEKQITLRQKPWKRGPVSNQYYLKMKQKMMNHKKNNFPLFGHNSTLQRQKNMHRFTLTCPVKKKQFLQENLNRPRKWSNSTLICQQTLTEYEPYIESALSQYELICASKQTIDKMFYKVLQQFGSKKKIDENDDKK